MLLDTAPLCVVFVLILAVNVPEPPAGITESNSVTAQPQEGFALMILTSVAPVL
jgi:hypothetical protein